MCLACALGSRHPGPTFYFLTNRDASNYKIVKIQVDSSAAQSGHPADLSGDVKTTDLLAEDKDALLSSATIINENKLIVIYMRNVQDEVWQYELKSGRQIKRLLPDRKSCSGTSADWD